MSGPPDRTRRGPELTTPGARQTNDTGHKATTVCRHCGALASVLRRCGPHVGKYCSAPGCGRWAGWLSQRLPGLMRELAAQEAERTQQAATPGSPGALFRADAGGGDAA